jgi:predicted SPOUT superfamily RNA methylase MTH1
MQHLRTITRKAAERRREQREILLQAHAARAASVAKGKAKRKWGYNRSALKRIEELGQRYDSDVSAGSKSKTALVLRPKQTTPSDSADAPAVEDDRNGMVRQKGKKRKNPAGDETAEASALQVEIEARSKSRRRGTFWNNYQRGDEA